MTPDGGIADVLRVDVPAGSPERAAIVRVSPDGKTASFDPGRDFVPMPGGAKKFTIRFDPRSRLYWTLVNPVGEPFRDRVPGSVRNLLALASSPDLRAWTVRRPIASHPEVARHGFQYPDWLFDGDDLIAVVRTAFDDERGGAHNYHDANYLTFHRIEDFRADPPR